MENNDVILNVLNELKLSLKELRDEIKEDINNHKQDNLADIQRLYDNLSIIKEKLTILETKIAFWQWFGTIGIVGAAGAIITSIMNLILK